MGDHRGVSLARIGMIAVWLAATGGMLVTAPMRDAPAWWQALLSGAALLTTAFLWQLDKEHQRSREEIEQRNLQQIIVGCVKELLRVTNRLLVRCDPESTAPRDREVKALLQDIEHRFLHLHTFSPYDRLGAFDRVQAVANVEVCCRSLLVFLEDGPPPISPRGALAGYLVTHRHRDAVQPFAEELAARCERACDVVLSR